MAKRRGTKQGGIPVLRRPRSVDSLEDERPSTASQFWRAERGDDCQGALWAWIDRLSSHTSSEQLEDLIHEAIYEGRPIGAHGTLAGLGHLHARRSAPANFNAIRSLVDTAQARLTKRRTMPVISADDADWHEKVFAKEASRVLRRKMGATDVERAHPTMIRDGIVRGTAYLKAVRHGGDVKIVRVPAHEIVVDPRESYYGPPRTMAHRRPVPRDVLLATYPDCHEAICDAARYSKADPWTQMIHGDPAFADLVDVVEAWHLPSAPDADDGMHVVAVRGAILRRRAWRRERFPLSPFYWSAPTRGHRGHGLVEDLAGLQAKVNDILRDAQEALYHGSALKIFAPRGAGVNKHHLRARHPVIIETDGAVPSFVAPNPVSAQSIQILEMLFAKMYEISGIGQMAAMSKNQLGSNASGKAIDTLDDLQSDRFAHVEASLMMARVDCGQYLVDAAGDLWREAHGDVGPYEECGPTIERSQLAPWIAAIDWRRVNVDEGEYHLVAEPINFLPDSRAGRLSHVAELSKAGLLPDPTMAADMFDEPDIVRANRHILGPKHRIDQIVTLLADEEAPLIDLLPDADDNTQLGKLMVRGMLKEAQANEAPESVLERYRAWLHACERIEQTRASGAVGAPSLAGAQSTSITAAPNAATLQAGPPGIPGMGPGNGVPPGVM